MNNNIELLEEIKEYIEKADKLSINIVENIRVGENIEEFINLIEGISYCIEGIYNLCNIGLENIEEETIKQYRENFNRNTNEMVEALENNDINLLADILEYEVVELISDLNNQIKNVNLI